MRICTVMLAVFVLFAGLTTAGAQEVFEADFYVAPDGDDADDGSYAAPFATVGRARDAVRQLIAAGLTDDVLVYLRGGAYYLDDAIAFGAEDSGTAEHRITYMGYPGETVSLNGGKPLQADWFGPVTDQSIRDRLLPEARDQVLTVALAAHGITEYPAITRRGFNFMEGPFDDREPPGGMELYFNGWTMQAGRWPNEGYETVAGTPDGRDGMRFQYSGDRPERWAEAKDIWFYGYWSAFWADCYFPVESIDFETKTVTIRPISQEEMDLYGMDEDEANGRYGIDRRRPYFALNLLEEIDVPGEYYLDRETGDLFFYPPDGLDEAVLYLSNNLRIAVLQDASYLTFRNIVFEGARDNLVEVEGGEGVAFHQCTFRGGGAYAVAMNGTAHVVDGCESYGMGAGVIGVDGGDRYQLISGENVIRNSHLHHYSRWSRMGTRALWVEGVGVTMSHNLIHDAVHMAILYSGNNHLIEMNEIYNVCRQTDDAGAIYTGRNYANRGTLIKNNFIHDVHSELNPAEYGDLIKEGVHGVYFDDAASESYVIGNVIYGIDTRDVMIGGGRDNLVEHNILSDSKSALFIDRRMLEMTLDEDYRQMIINRIEEYNYTEPPWSEAYPLLAAMFDSETPWEPENNRIIGNLGHDTIFWVECGFWGSSIMETLMCVPRDFLIEEDNLERCANPGYVDEENLNLALQPNSPAYTIPGFEEIPFAEIGLAPEPPVLFITATDFAGKAAGVTVAGYCEPYAHIVSATFGGRDVKEFLSIGTNGAIAGVIALTGFDESPTALEMVIAGPKGPASEPGYSAEVEVPLAPGDDDAGDDDAIPDDDDDTDDGDNGDDAAADDDDDDSCGC